MPATISAVINRAIARAAPWECRRCGVSTPGAALLVADRPEREIASAEIAAAATLESATSPPSPSPSMERRTEGVRFIDERLLRCPRCGSREIEIPIEVLDTKRLR